MGSSASGGSGGHDLFGKRSLEETNFSSCCDCAALVYVFVAEDVSKDL